MVKEYSYRLHLRKGLNDSLF